METLHDASWCKKENTFSDGNVAKVTTIFNGRNVLMMYRNRLQPRWHTQWISCFTIKATFVKQLQQQGVQFPIAETWYTSDMVKRAWIDSEPVIKEIKLHWIICMHHFPVSPSCSGSQPEFQRQTALMPLETTIIYRKQSNVITLTIAIAEKMHK